MTTTYGGTLDLDDGSVRIVADRGNRHAAIVVPRPVVEAGGGEAIALAVAMLDRMLDDETGHAYRST